MVGPKHGASVEQELELSDVDSAKRVENEWKEGRARWCDGDVWHALVDFMLVHRSWEVDIFQDSGVEILLLDWRDDGDITEDQFVERLDETRGGEDEIPAIVSSRFWLFFGR